MNIQMKCILMELEINDLKIFVESKMSPNIQSNLEKNKARGITALLFQTTLQSHGNQIV